MVRWTILSGERRELRRAAGRVRQAIGLIYAYAMKSPKPTMARPMEAGIAVANQEAMKQPQ
jgi:hypothetical protein